MSGHTPGPWKEELAMRIGGSAGAFTITVETGEVVICSRAGWPTRAIESEANARLIAAAPDLLAACKALVEGEGEVPVMDLARAAIAKAEGAA